MFPDFHPAVSSAPAIILILVVLFECCGSSSVLLVRAWAASVIITYVTGQYAAELAGELDSATLDLLSWHQTFGKLILFFGSIMILFSEVNRIKPSRNTTLLFRVSIFICVSLSIYNSYQGGELVFERGVNVKRTSADTPQDD